MSRTRLTDEILKWSTNILDWQRDALRRLVVAGDLDDKDVAELTEICKASHGLSEETTSIPLSEEHIPTASSDTQRVILDSITHKKGVNALAENQTLRFGPQITTVYGDNGAGKTGYIRILKTACLARSREKILSNVVSGEAPEPYEVTIGYIKGENPPTEWNDGNDPDLARVSIFDTQCASVYLTEKTDVAFRPYGLDLFDRLVQASKQVKERLEYEQQEHAVSRIPGPLSAIPEETSVGKVLAKISGLTNPDDVRALATLTDAEVARIDIVNKSIADLRSADPGKQVRRLELLQQRASRIKEHMDNVLKVLSSENIESIADAREELRRCTQAVDDLREATIQSGTLPGTGNSRWKALWESAKEYSYKDAYPGEEFPFTADQAKCVLCQQDLVDSAVTRMDQFHEYVTSKAEQSHRVSKEVYDNKVTELKELAVAPRDVEESITAIAIDNEELAGTIREIIEKHSERKKATCESIETGHELPSDDYIKDSDESAIKQYIRDLTERVSTINAGNSEEALKALEEELIELGSRRILNEQIDDVIAEIDRQKRVAAYQLAINDTRTNGITQKSTSLTREVVTAQLHQTFKEELHGLGFKHIDVDLVEAGGAEGVLYHKLELAKAPGYKLPLVVSEGEQRCLSIAAFFAELSTADDNSAIVFDDPMSSLDNAWRRRVAKRLVKEASTRQVIVFTHDIAFLLMLKQLSGGESIDHLDQHVRQLPIGAGICSEELPWVAMPVNKRIGYIKNQWQSSEKDFRTGNIKEYEKDAQYLYGLLRETWERAVEEILLNMCVERYRPDIQTQRVKMLTDVSEEDYERLEKGMKKCSAWMTGHDQSSGAPEPIPEPVELNEDIMQLETWCGEIRKRRSKPK